MVSANAIAQVIPLLIAPLLTRLYRPEDFASLALFASTLGIAQVVATMRVDWLISSAKNDERAKVLLQVGVRHVIVVSIATGIVVISGKLIGFGWATTGLLAGHLWLLPLAVLGAGLQVMLASWFVWDADLAPVASAKIRQSIASASIQLGGGLLASGAWGLVLGVIAQSWTGVFRLSGTARKRVGGLCSAVPPAVVRLLAREVGRRYLVTGLTGVMNVSGLMLPPIIVGVYYTPTELGWFSLMQRLALGPVGILTAAVSQSFWAEAGQLAKTDPGGLQRLHLRTAGRLAIVGAGVGGVCCLGPVFIGSLFGEKAWGGAGAVLLALAPAVVAQIVVSTLSPILAVLEKEAWLLVWDTCRTAAIVAGFVIAGRSGIGLQGAVLVFSVTTAGMYFALFLKQLSLLRIEGQPLLSKMTP